MRIEFEVPDWVIGSHIYVFAGTELLADKRVQVVHENGEHVTKYLPLRIKPEGGRCNGCGTCCEDGSVFPMEIMVKIKEALKQETEHCEFLTKTGCLLGSNIPFSCVRSLCTHYDGCSELMKEVE